MNISFHTVGLSIVTSIFLLSGCSGSGMVAGSASTNGSTSTQDDLSSQSGDTDETTNIVTDSGNMISQGSLPETLNSITSGSGDILVNLGEAVSTLGDALVFNSVDIDENYLSNLVEGVAQTTTKLGTTVDSVGTTVAQLDVLPVFVQLNNGTGILTYAGGTVSELGGVVENVGGWLEYHTGDESGALYGLTHTLSAMTVPIVVQTADMLNVKGNALVLFEDATELKQSLPQFLFLTKTHLVEGTQALLVDPNGLIANLGTAFVGEHGLLAVLFDGVGEERSLLSPLLGREDGSETGLTLGQSTLLDIAQSDSSLGVLTQVSGSLALVTHNLSALLDVSADVDGQFTLSHLLGEHSAVSHTLGTTLGGVVITTTALVDGVVQTSTNLLGGGLDSGALSSNQTAKTSFTEVLVLDSSEQNAGLLDSLTSTLLTPLTQRGQ